MAQRELMLLDILKVIQTLEILCNGRILISHAYNSSLIVELNGH
jgi:hypothetical protein